MTKGESNMKFVCQMLQKRDPYSPSLAQLRRFTLPDFKPPTKVHYLKQTKLKLCTLIFSIIVSVEFPST